MGAPLGKGQKVTPSGDSAALGNDYGGYSVLQSDSKEALTELLKGHPHFMMPGGYIEVVGDHADPRHVTGRAARPMRCGRRRVTDSRSSRRRAAWSAATSP